MIEKTLNEAYNYWNGSSRHGVFFNISGRPHPWSATPDILDREYYGRSGDKRISPYIERLLNENEVLDSTTKDFIAYDIENLYMKKWDKIWDVMFGEHSNYNPVENYNRKETEKVGKKTENNPTDGVNVSITTVSAYGDPELTDASKTETTSGIGNITLESGTLDGGTNRETTITGNIGVMSSQDMVGQTIDLYREHEFWDIVFSDIDKLLTLSIY